MAIGLSVVLVDYPKIGGGRGLELSFFGESMHFQWGHVVET